MLWRLLSNLVVVMQTECAWLKFYFFLFIFIFLIPFYLHAVQIQEVQYSLLTASVV
jgi:hypothetical protein